MARPNEWAKIYEGPRKRAHNLSQNARDFIKRSISPGYGHGKWEITVRTVAEDKGQVFVKWVPQQTH